MTKAPRSGHWTTGADIFAEAGKGLCSFRLSNRVFSECAKAQIVHTVPKDAACVYSSDALKRFLDEESVVYASEAEIKTYPTDFLLKDFARYLANAFDEDTVVGLSSDGKCVFKCEANSRNVSVLRNDEEIDTTSTIVVRTNFANWDTEKKVAGRVSLEILDKVRDLSTKTVADLINGAYLYGYNFVTWHRKINGPVVVVFESKFQEGEFDVEDRLYHICPERVVAKILKQGLVPKSKSNIGGQTLHHDDRVYLLTNEPDAGTVRRFAMTSQKVRPNEKMVVLSIDIAKVPHLKLYRDNMTLHDDETRPDAVYTLNNIPPRAIRVEKEIDV